MQPEIETDQEALDKPTLRQRLHSAAGDRHVEAIKQEHEGSS